MKCEAKCQCTKCNNRCGGCQDCHNRCKKRWACHDYNHDIGITFSRVCSQYRSQIPYPQFIFFEEMRRPTLSIEASVAVPMQIHDNGLNDKMPLIAAPIAWGLFPNIYQQQKSCSSCHCNSCQQYQYVNFLVESVDLSGVDLFEGRVLEKVNFTLKNLAEQYPKYWENAMLTVQVCDDVNGNGICSDEIYPRVVTVNTPSFGTQKIPNSVVVDVWHGRNFLIWKDPEYCEQQYSPLVLDLAGDGIRLQGPEKGTVFDLNDTGTPVYTGWTEGVDDAFLVRDVNGNGRIDSGAELFGSATRLKDGRRAANGFEALRELDANGDNRITPDDPAWRELRLWVDRNQNGISERGEILTLNQARMESISLDYVSGVVEVDEHGNETRMRSTFRRTINGKSTALVAIDVWFNTLVRHDIDVVSR